MAKFRSPFDTNELWITQTLHTQSGNTAIDLSAVAETPVYAIADGKVTYRSSQAGSYCVQEVDNSLQKIYYVHTYKWVETNTWVKKGDMICRIAPSSINGGYPTHLHLGLQSGFSIMDYFDRGIVFRTKYQAIKDVWFTGENLNWSLFKDLSYNGEPMSNFKVGDRIKITNTQWIRGGAGDKFDEIRSTVIGELGTIIDGARTSQNKQFGKGENDGYTWFDVKFDDGTTGWCAEVKKWEIYQDPPQGAETTLPFVECQKEVKRLEGVVTDLKSAVKTRETTIQKLTEDSEKLEASLKEEKKISKESGEEVEELKKKNKTLQDDKLELEERLSKGSLTEASTGEIFAEIWRRITRSIK